MAHEIEVRNGKYSFFSVKETPWHGKGVLIQEAPSIQEGLKLAGLDWTVSKHKMKAFLPDGTLVPAETEMVVRNSDMKRLGEVGPKWKPLQNQQAFEWFDPFLKSGSATLETAGSLFEGRRIFVLSKLTMNDAVIVPGSDDRVAKFVLLSNSHDGTLAVRVGFTPIRVVCANTLAMATNNRASKLIRIRHTAKMEDTLLKVRECMNLVNQEFETTAEKYRLLAQSAINSNDLKNYIKMVFKKDKKDEEEETSSSVVSTEEEKKRTVDEDDGRLIENKILPFYEGNTLGADLKGVRGTLWGAYNAIVAFLSYERGRTQDERLNQLWFGNSLTANKKALDLAVKAASGKLDFAAA